MHDLCTAGALCWRDDIPGNLLFCVYFFTSMATGRRLPLRSCRRSTTFIEQSSAMKDRLICRAGAIIRRRYDERFACIFQARTKSFALRDIDADSRH